MLERYWVEQEKKGRYLSSFMLSLSFGLVALMLAYFFVPFRVGGTNYGGIVAVLLASLGAAYPLMRYLEGREMEEKRMETITENKLLGRHWAELKVYLSFFLGAMVAFYITGFLLPGTFFSIQNSVITSITGKASGGVFFYEIIANNLSVYMLTFVLSFFLAAGMIFILVWNASILGLFLSNATKTVLHIPGLTLAYLPHGILEVSAYILAGISGFFLSYHLEYFIEGDSKGRAIELSKDSIFLLLIGLIMLFAAGLLEVL